ncbi:EAL domain-containing protein [Raoultella planticola]|uniref:EAL domain-containing protein n=1 Tax=Raoultella planticola TaxID=575 RepID=UPI001F533A6D|nr:EAL domain-containing protein [Raoultella planticola]UNK75765.1 EAL domain-containing protein [Raoultella planticola]
MIKDSVGIESYKFSLEPSYKKDGSIHSWEILTKKVIKKNSSDGMGNEMVFRFDFLSEEEVIDVFNKQLLITQEIDSLRLKNKSISLNVDSIIVDYILGDHYISDYINNSKNIVFEINERFHEFKKMTCMAELKLLSRLCPVWLDDFGRGFTSIKLLELFRFDCVKIDKDYFWDIQYKNNFTEKLKEVKSYCDFIIVEGVETIEQKNKVFSFSDCACQGRLWEDDYYYIEC